MRHTSGNVGPVGPIRRGKRITMPFILFMCWCRLTSLNLTGWPDLIRLSLEERCLWPSNHCTSSGDIISKFSITLCSIRLIFPRATGKSTVSMWQSRFLTLIFPIVSISQHTCFFDVTILLLAVPTGKCTVTTRVDQKNAGKTTLYTVQSGFPGNLFWFLS